MKKRKKKIFVVSFLWIGFLIICWLSLTGYIFAADYGLDTAAKEAGLADKGKANIIEVTGTIIDLVLGYLGLVFLVLTIYGGLMWMTAGGNPENVKKAKSLISNAVIGLLIIFASYGIAHLVFGLVGVKVGSG